MFLNLFDDPKCYICHKKIQGNEEVYIRLVYPKRRGQTEIKAFLRNEGVFYCKKCFVFINTK